MTCRKITTELKAAPSTVISNKKPTPLKGIRAKKTYSKISFRALSAFCPKSLGLQKKRIAHSNQSATEKIRKSNKTFPASKKKRKENMTRQRTNVTPVATSTGTPRLTTLPHAYSSCTNRGLPSCIHTIVVVVSLPTTLTTAPSSPTHCASNYYPRDIPGHTATSARMPEGIRAQTWAS